MYSPLASPTALHAHRARTVVVDTARRCVAGGLLLKHGDMP